MIHSYRRLYLDLDGVMADFDKHFFDLFGVASRGLPDNVLWAKVDSVPTFFRDLPMCPGAAEFYDWVDECYWSPTILTACPKFNYPAAAKQKREWSNEHLVRYGCTPRVIPMLGGKNKVLFMHAPGDILVDDHQPNIDSWIEGGGEGILHTGDWTETIRRMKELA